MKAYSIFSIAFILTGFTALQAQEFKTNKSVTDQLKNNTAPDLRYASTNTGRQTTSKPHVSMSTALKQGNLDGVKFAPQTGKTVEPAQKKQMPANTKQQAELSSAKAYVKTDSVAKKSTPATITGQGDISFEKADEASRKKASKELKPAALPTQDAKPTKQD